MKINNFENIKNYWNSRILDYTTFLPDLKVTDAYIYVDKQLNTIYTIVLHCKWRVELYIDDGGIRGDGLSVQWHLELKNLNGLYYMGLMATDVVRDKYTFTKIILQRVHAEYLKCQSVSIGKGLGL